MLLFFFFQSVVQFRHREDAEKAIKELHGTEFKGRTIHIREVGQLFLPIDVQCSTGTGVHVCACLLVGIEQFSVECCRNQNQSYLSCSNEPIKT